MSLPTLLVESNAALPLVHVGVSRLTGSLEDPVGKEGATRLLARLMRRSAGGRSADELDTTLDRMGATLGAEVSGSTVSFSGAVISRNLEPFLALLGDVVARPSLDEDEFERLRRETRAELVDALDNDRTLARRWFRKSMFSGHPYGRSAIGTNRTLDSITRDDVRRQLHDTWVQENVVVTFAGDIADAQAENAASQLVSALPAGAARTDDTPDPSGLTGRHLVIVDKPERTQTQILIGTLGTSPHDDDHTALTVANTVFGGTFTARLCQEVRAKRGWSYGAYSSLPYDRRRHAFSMWTFPKASDAAACVALELQMLEDWISKGLRAEELAGAQAYLVNSNAFSVDTAAKRLGLRLDERIYGLPAGYFSEFVDRVKAVTVEEANQAIARRISAKDLLVTVVGTESEIGDEVRAAVGDLASSTVVAFDAE